MKTPLITDNDYLGHIVAFALRYALWRHSAAPSVVSHFIKNNITHPALAQDRHRYIEEIGKHLANVTEYWNKDTLYAIDLNTWQDLLAFLKSSTLTTTNNNKRKDQEMKENTQLYINPIYDCDYGDLIGYEIAHADGLPEVIIYGGKKNMRTLEEAKADAEDECARLNAEYRKEQS